MTETLRVKVGREQVFSLLSLSLSSSDGACKRISLGLTSSSLFDSATNSGPSLEVVWVFSVLFVRFYRFHSLTGGIYSWKRSVVSVFSLFFFGFSFLYPSGGAFGVLR